MCNGKKEFKIKRGQFQKTYDDEDGGDESDHGGDDNGDDGSDDGGDDNGDNDGGGGGHEDGGGNFGGDDEDALKKDANVGPATVE